MPQPIPNKSAWLPVLTEWYGDEKARVLLSDAQARYDDLYDGRQRLDRRALRVHLEKNILPGLALYQALLADGLDQQAAVERVTQLWDALVVAQVRRLTWLMHMPSFFGAFRFVVRTMMTTVFPPDHWDTEWLEDSPRRIAFNVHHCFYLNTFREYGAPELTPAFCATDDVMIAGFASKVVWGRTMTLGRGGEYCNFCYRNAQPQGS